MNRPEDEVANHLLGSDANTFRYMIWDVQIRGPYRANTLGHRRGSGVGLNGVPEEGSDHTNDDGEAGEVPSKGGPHCNRERHMKTSTNNTIEYERDGTANGSKDDTVHSLAPSFVN